MSFPFCVLVMVLNTPTILASYDGNKTDHLALLSFKSKITHDPYGALASWNASFHFCDWKGVICGKRHIRVTTLHLAAQGLEGSLSPRVGNLSFFHVLLIQNNSFQGTIPNELGRLSRLRILYLHRNKFNGIIPSNMSGCSNLEELWLAYNKLSGSIPKEITFLLKLCELAIHYNGLTGGTPPSLGNKTSMEVFDARNIPATLGNWKNLREIYTNGCNLTGFIPHSIYNLSLLTELSMAANLLNGDLPLTMGSRLPHLQYLHLWGNPFIGTLPPSISNCSKLRFLGMADSKFSGMLRIDFSKLRDIQHFVLGNTGREEANAPELIDSSKNCSNLEVFAVQNYKGRNLSVQLHTLVLSKNQLYGKIPSSIGNLVGLDYLNLGTNHLTGKIPLTIGKLQKFQAIFLHKNGFSGQIPDALV